MAAERWLNLSRCMPLARGPRELVHGVRKQKILAGPRHFCVEGDRLHNAAGLPGAAASRRPHGREPVRHVTAIPPITIPEATTRLVSSA
jgi:hypothetical protein